MAEMLTPAQRLAVNDRGGKLLVSAAAGSGKTKVLVDRLLSYITDPKSPCNIDDFLIITYTKAAASELRGKIANKLTERVAASPENRHLQKQIQRLYLTKISTVHAFCSDVLRENAYKLDIAADFRVADERECEQLQLQVMERLLESAYDTISEDADFQAFIETQGFGRDDRKVPEIILQVYHAAQCHLDPDGWLENCIVETDVDGLTDASQTAWGQYLLEDLRRYLHLQIQAMNNCVTKASQTDGMQKVATLLADTVNQLKTLQACGTWNEVISAKNIDYGRLIFPKSCTDTALIDSIKAVRDTCKKRLAQKLSAFASESAQVLADLQSAGASAKGLVKLVRKFSKAYDLVKQSRHVLDFGDLEHKTLDLLLGKKRTGPTVFAFELGRRFREIMVDEYQDSNAVQDAIFSALTVDAQNCFMVGDVKQSIYQFRLADPGIFLEKYNTYLPAGEAAKRQGRKVLLSSNFRSAGPVIDAVNDVFCACMSRQIGGLEYGPDEMLHEGISHISNTETEVEFFAIQVDHDTYAEEAACAADKIVQLLDGTHMVRDGERLRPIIPGDIVILLRSPGSVGGEFVHALASRGVRCTTGSGCDLLRTEEIGTLRALLQIISNPLQDIPLLAVLTSRVFQFTADDLAAFRGKRRYGNIYDALSTQPDEKASAFLNVLGKLRREARLCSLSELLEKIFMITRIDSIFAAESDGENRKANLHAFCKLATECEHGGQKELDQFLDFLDAMEEKGLTLSGDQKSSDMVTIMSIHKSKGLEFPVVFLCGLSKSFNQESARAQVLCDRDLGLGLSCVDLRNRVRYPTIAKRAIANKMISDSISEEMRVLYVAMTRARDRLIMTYADKDLALHMSELVGRMDLSPRELLTGDVNCSGTWVMQTALRRTEAGELFAVCGRPNGVSVPSSFWNIRVIEAATAGEQEYIEEKATVAPSVDPNILRRISSSLSFSYPWSGAAHFPSKQTATQLKGRLKDDEAAEDTDVSWKQLRQWRSPSFISKQKDGIQYGNVLHSFMQYVRYDVCKDTAGITSEISRLISLKLLPPETEEMLDTSSLSNFFGSEMGKKLINSESVLREFKFSILDNAQKYGCTTANEDVLLQGVVDCAIIEPDGITILDFKTDRVTEENIDSVASRYRGQVLLYADAMARIFKTKIKAAQLYFFHLNRYVPIV